MASSLVRHDRGKEPLCRCCPAVCTADQPIGNGALHGAAAAADLGESMEVFEAVKIQFNSSEQSSPAPRRHCRASPLFDLLPPREDEGERWKGRTTIYRARDRFTVVARACVDRKFSPLDDFRSTLICVKKCDRPKYLLYLLSVSPDLAHLLFFLSFFFCFALFLPLSLLFRLYFFLLSFYFLSPIFLYFYFNFHIIFIFPFLLLYHFILFCIPIYFYTYIFLYSPFTISVILKFLFFPLSFYFTLYYFIFFLFLFPFLLL
jgi:hypothetical protein